MIKKILVYIFSFTALFIAGYFSQQNLLSNPNEEIPFSLLDIYIFLGIFSLAICIVFNILSNIPKIFSQLGFIYLGVLVFKLTLFSMVFYNSIIAVELTKYQALYALIPIGLFLILEVVFIAKILNKK